jgi:hypothetical protein
MDLNDAIVTLLPKISDGGLTYIVSNFLPGEPPIPFIEATACNSSIALVMKKIVSHTDRYAALIELKNSMIKKSREWDASFVPANILGLPVPYLLINTDSNSFLFQSPRVRYPRGETVFASLAINHFIHNRHPQVAVILYPQQTNVQWYSMEGKIHQRSHVRMLANQSGPLNHPLHFSANDFTLGAWVLQGKPFLEYIANPFQLTPEHAVGMQQRLTNSLAGYYYSELIKTTTELSGREAIRPKHTFAAYAQMIVNLGLKYSYLVPNPSEAFGIEELQDSDFIERMLKI